MPITYYDFIDALINADETNGGLDIIRQYIQENPSALQDYFIDAQDIDSYADSNEDLADRDTDVAADDVDINTTSEDYIRDEDISTTEDLDLEADQHPHAPQHESRSIEATNSEPDTTNPSTIEDGFGRTQQTAMDIALCERNLYSVSLLIELGADINQIIHKSRFGNHDFIHQLLMTGWYRGQPDLPFITVLGRSQFKAKKESIADVIWGLYTRTNTHPTAQTIGSASLNIIDNDYLALKAIMNTFNIKPEMLLHFLISRHSRYPQVYHSVLISKLIQDDLNVNFVDNNGITFLHNLIKNSMSYISPSLIDTISLFLNHPELDLAQLNANGKTIFEYKELPESIHKLLVDKQFESIHDQRLGNNSFFSRAPRDVIEYVLKPMVKNRRTAISPSDSLENSSEDLKSHANDASDEKTAADAAAPPIATEDDIPTKNTSSPRRKN